MRPNYEELLTQCQYELNECDLTMRGYYKELTKSVIYLVLANFKVKK